ncbi:MAG TPA: hypothetical protein VKP30_27625, partial [Polyangiaceae bacterium]|nr:hypothetical protein [Polyangiaceae bacterium]
GPSSGDLGGATSGGASVLPGTGGASRVTGAAGTSGRCLLPLVECSGSCVDLTNNPDHCGSCGHACFQASASWAVCVQRLCSCDGGATKCNAGAACEKKDACVSSAK